MPECCAYCRTHQPEPSGDGWVTVIPPGTTLDTERPAPVCCGWDCVRKFAARQMLGPALVGAR